MNWLDKLERRFGNLYIPNLMTGVVLVQGVVWLLQTITHQRGFERFCHEHELISRSGKSCATSAEAVYAYITKNPDYTEEHTALSDALIEMAIFVKCYSMHKKFTKNAHQWDCKGKEFNKCFPKW